MTDRPSWVFEEVVYLGSHAIDVGYGEIVEDQFEIDGILYKNPRFVCEESDSFTCECENLMAIRPIFEIFFDDGAHDEDDCYTCAIGPREWSMGEQDTNGFRWRDLISSDGPYLLEAIAHTDLY